MGCSPTELTAVLPNGRRMPRLAFGTFKLRGEQCKDAVEAAIKAGIRHIDTASIYKNEEDVGAAIRNMEAQGVVTRHELFVTSKASPYEMISEQIVREALQNSLQRLGLEYLDLYLLHWPGRAKLPLDSHLHRSARESAWKGLLNAVDCGLVRSVGVSNFQSRHLEDVKGFSVNQLELHPRVSQQEAVEATASAGAIVQSYSPFGTGDLLVSKQVVDLAKSVALSPCQLLLQYAFAKGRSVVFKSSRPDRIRENVNFHVEPLSLSVIQALDAMQDGHHYCWNSEQVL